jgi:hypothetical protein
MWDGIGAPFGTSPPNAASWVTTATSHRWAICKRSVIEVRAPRLDRKLAALLEVLAVASQTPFPQPVDLRAD